MFNWKLKRFIKTLEQRRKRCTDQLQEMKHVKAPEDPEAYEACKNRLRGKIDELYVLIHKAHRI